MLLYGYKLIFAIYPGIGFALAKQFLKAGDNVVICSRSGKIFSMIESKFPRSFFPPLVRAHLYRTLNKLVQDCRTLTKELDFPILTQSNIITACRGHFQLFRVGHF